MRGFTQDLLDTLNTNFNEGIKELSEVLATLPKPIESHRIIRMIIATVAKNISILKDPMPLSEEAEEALLAYQPAIAALATMTAHPQLLRYCRHIIEISAKRMQKGTHSEFIARVLNSLAMSKETHILMLDEKILPLTLAAFRAEFKSYYTLSKDSSDANTVALRNARTKLSQYSILLFNLLRDSRPTLERFKIKIRDEIKELLAQDHNGTGKFSRHPGHPCYQPIGSFIGSIQTTSSYRTQHSPTLSSLEPGSISSHSTTTPQTALSLSISSIGSAGSLHTVRSYSAPSIL